MDKKFSVKELIRSVKTSPFLLYCEMPLGYAEGLPILQIRNGRLFLLIPFLKYQLTGQVDKTLVYPVRYCVTVQLPEGKVTGFCDLATDPRFARVDFSKPVGLFRHEAIRHLNKQAYKQTREQLLQMYDRVVAALLWGEPYTEEDEQQMAQTLQMMLEPSLLPVYKALDEEFYEKYLV